MFVNFFSNLVTASFGFFIIIITGIIGLLAYLGAKYRQQDNTSSSNKPNQ